MKKFLFTVLALASFNAFSSPVVCYQGDGDSRFDLRTDGKLMAIVYTNDSDESELVYYDSYKVSFDNKTLSAGRYIVRLNGDHSSLVKLVGREEVVLTDILECKKTQTKGLNTWVSEFMRK